MCVEPPREPSNAVSDGSDGLFDPDGSTIDGVGVSQIDILSGHPLRGLTELTAQTTSTLPRLRCSAKTAARLPCALCRHRR